MPLAELIEDSAIYPRHVVDDQHVSSLFYKIEAGANLPPIVADAHTKRIVDGWHRSRAWRRKLGPTGVVDVDLREYASEQEVLLDAVRLNADHGRKLDTQDLVRISLMLQEAGISTTEIALALTLPEERVVRLTVRLAEVPASPAPTPGTIPGTNKVALKQPVRWMAGQTVTPRQASAMTSVPGTSWLLIANQLSSGLRNGLVNPEDERLRVAFTELRDALDQFLS